MGFSNIKAMIPFVRTVDEASKVIEQMAHNDLIRGQNGFGSCYDVRSSF